MFLVEWPGGSWQTLAITAGLIIGAYVAVMWLAAVFWTVRDAHSRIRNPIAVAGAGLLVLAGFVPGIWIYLILRPRLTLASRFERSLEAEAVLAELADRLNCPRCAKRVRDDFIICPSCRCELKEPCVNCTRPLNFAWVVCPSCGTERARAVAAAQLLPRRERRRRRPRDEAKQAQPQPQLTGTPGS